MNSERLLRLDGDAVSLFRQIFKNAIGQAMDQGSDITSLGEIQFLEIANYRKEMMSWEFENMDITAEEERNFDGVMLDYMKDLTECIRDHGGGNDCIKACFAALFS